ncbi:hypothetical protein [Myroides odoratimimus]|uniref:hypothetical protein n=1 Tax=Myroides odoratimimus TaxID=76832 RepID=UPI000B254A44|nr:hypothetical protein [Myroides odoratimimus]
MKVKKLKATNTKLSNNEIVKQDMVFIKHSFKVLTTEEVNKNRSSKYQFITF